MAPSSFGLNPDTALKYILEEIFQLVQHCRISYSEAWDMPIVIRHWWINRISKEHEEEQQKPRNRAGEKGGHTDPFGRKHP